MSLELVHDKGPFNFTVYISDDEVEDRFKLRLKKTPYQLHIISFGYHRYDFVSTAILQFCVILVPHNTCLL